MEKIKSSSILCCCALLLAACSSENEYLDSNLLPEGAVLISSTIGAVQTRSPQLDADGEGNFESGDVWGLYTFNGDAVTPNFSNENIEYYADNRNPLLWKDLGEGNVTFSAHYPRLADPIDDPTAYKFGLWGDIEHSDLLFATATQSKGEKVELGFKHLMHRLVINLKNGQGMEDVDLSAAVIRTSSQSGEATMKGDILINLLTGELGQPSGNASYNYFASDFDRLAVPQTLIPGDDWLEILIGTEVWHYQVPFDLDDNRPGNQTTLESGKRLTLNLVVRKNSMGQPDVVLQSSDISGWESPDSPIEDDVAISSDFGTIDMTGMTSSEVATAIATVLDSGATELTLKGPATYVGEGAFAGSQITKIDMSATTDWQNTILEGLNPSDKTGLPRYMFSSCNALTEVKLPAEMEAIGADAFNGCSMLASINLEGVQHIGFQAFYECSSLPSVTLTNCVNLCDRAFYKCNALTEVHATALKELQSSYAFYSCVKLTTVDMPVLEIIGESAFMYCEKLETVYIPAAKLVKSQAFLDCESLAAISMENVTELATHAFSGCSKLATVDFPAVETIGEYVFDNCTSLRSLELPANKVGNGAFSGCGKLETLSLPNLTTFGNYIVENCSSLKNLKLTAAGSLVTIGGGAIVGGSLKTSSSLFDSSKCVLTLNTDKKQGGNGSPKVTGSTKWVGLTWKSISYQ